MKFNYRNEITNWKLKYENENEKGDKRENKKRK